MKYREVGKTGIKVSEIGFGCGNNAVLMVKAPYEDQLKAVRHALSCGITFFDTAFAYGLGKSEENLGRILKDLGANPVISTKIRLESDAVSDVKAATIRALESGLQRLGRERVDFVQLHTRVTVARGMGKRFSLTPADVLGPNGVIDGFKTLRDRGKVGFFGFSGLGETKALHELGRQRRVPRLSVLLQFAQSQRRSCRAGEFYRPGLSSHSRSRRGQGHGRLCHSHTRRRRADF